jgi:hypothetical protein
MEYQIDYIRSVLAMAMHALEGAAELSRQGRTTEATLKLGDATAKVRTMASRLERLETEALAAELA